MNRKRITSALMAVFMVALAVPVSAFAEPITQVVTEVDVARQLEDSPPTNNWVVYTRAGTPDSAAVFQNGPATPPLGSGSLQLTTTSGSEKVYAFNFEHIGKSLAGIDTISYGTYRSAGNDQQVAALNVVIDYNGSDPGGFSTLVFEPVYNTNQGAVISGQWQNWDAYNGGNAVWWSSKNLPDPNNTGEFIACNPNDAEANTPACAGKLFVPLSTITAAFPNATVNGGVGVNQGSGNPGLTTSVDAFIFDDVTYNFELVAPKPVKAMTKDECKNGGWESNFQTAYKNQGDCVSSVVSNGKNQR